jgi:hypothetical protein
VRRCSNVDGPERSAPRIETVAIGRATVCTLGVIMLAACSFGSGGRQSGPSPTGASETVFRSSPPRVREPVRLRRTPAWVLDACGGFAISMRRFCPSVIPAGGNGRLTMSIVLASRLDPINILDLEAGSESVGDQRRNRPPRLVGVLLASGKLRQALPGLLPRRGAVPGRIHDGLANAARRKPLSLGRRTWAGRVGELGLAPSRGRYPLAYFRYLFFQWHDSNGAHALGLRVWEPFTESVRTLHRLADGLAPQPAMSFAHPTRPAQQTGVAMARTPGWLLAACRALRTRPICPAQIPAARANSVDVFFEPNILGPGGRQDWISAEWGTPHGDTAENRPPRFVHLDLKAGALPLHKRFQHPPVPVRDGLFRIRSTGPIPLGPVSWAGRNGELILGDCFGNHLCFRWGQLGVGYQIDLHGWEPFTQAVAALEAVIASLPAG